MEKIYISKKLEVFKSLYISKSLLNTLNLDIITKVSITNWGYQMDYIKSAKIVLGKKIQLLLKLNSSLDNSFIQSCRLIKQTSGKTIFVDLGKSGHIAEKCDTFIFGFIHKNTIL